MELDQRLKETLIKVAEFCDKRKVGDIGPLGFRRSSDLKRVLACLERLLDERVIRPDETCFMDLGCADGRLNLLLSYVVEISAGIELDEWSLKEYIPLKTELEKSLTRAGLIKPPDNIFLFHGDATDEKVHEKILRESEVALENFDLFYTYLCMHEEFAGLIAERAKKNAIFMVYGLDKTLPKYEGLRLLDNISPMEGILALYRKE